MRPWKGMWAEIRLAFAEHISHLHLSTGYHVLGTTWEITKGTKKPDIDIFEEVSIQLSRKDMRTWEINDTRKQERSHM